MHSEGWGSFRMARTGRWPWLASPAALILLAVAAFGLALWRFGVAQRWQAVCALAFSPDGRTLAVGEYSGKHFNENLHWCIGDLGQTVTLFDAATGSCDGVLEHVRHSGTSWGLPSTPLGQFLGFSPDGSTLAIGHWDGTVKLWDPKTN